MIVFVVLVGLLGGPALNQLIQRLPRRQSVLAMPCCEQCAAPLTPRELLPVGSWLWRRGRCRHCGERARARVLLVELALPLACGLLWLRDGWGWPLVVHAGLVAFFIAVFFIDLEHRLVLNRMTVPGLFAALVAAIGGVGPTLPEALLGALVGFVFLLVPFLLLPGLGMGDVKLAAVIGAVVGFPTVLTALSTGVLLAGAVVGVLLLTRRIGRRDTLAYAPYLVIGVLLVLFGLIGGNA